METIVPKIMLSIGMIVLLCVAIDTIVFGNKNPMSKGLTLISYMFMESVLIVLALINW